MPHPGHVIVRTGVRLRIILLLFAVAMTGVVQLCAEPGETNVMLNSAPVQTSRTKQIPFKQVIAATTQFQVLDFDTNNPAHAELLKTILRAAALAGKRAAADGIEASRANEAGNLIEPYVRAALNDVGLRARVPVNAAGSAQEAGYPDLEIIGRAPCYLELKTYNASAANTTQRTFYYSPSAHPKITRDALHLLLAYQLEKISRDGKVVFVPVHWKLITLQDLVVDLKLEYNQSNRALYGSSKASLGEGGLE